MIDNFKNNGSIENYITNYVNNINLISKEELLNNAKNSINELKNRTKIVESKVTGKNIFVICIADFIEKNYKDKLLFYSMNHPTKYMIQYVCENIVKILNIKRLCNIDYNLELLTQHKCILYKCIKPLVNFDISKKKLQFSNKQISISSLTKLYHKTYSKLDLKLIN